MNRSSLILPRTQHKVVLLVVLTMFAVDCLQTCRCKTRELWGLFAEVRETPVVWFRSYYMFRKNTVLNICRYLKGFYRIRLNLSFWKTQIKNITNTHINRFGPPQQSPDRSLSNFWRADVDLASCAWFPLDLDLDRLKVENVCYEVSNGNLITCWAPLHGAFS